MNRPFVTVSLWAITLGLVGCATPQACKEHEKIRSCVLHLYTDQIMDNLVRAANGLPIIQLDYSDMSTTITVDASGSYQGSQSLVDTRKLTLPAKTLELTRQFTNGFMFNLMGRNTDQVVIRASPVTNRDEVYNAYLEFLNEEGSLVVTSEAPSPCAAHVMKCCGDKYYWVPNEPRFKALFLRLALVTTAQRGQPLLPPEEFFEATVKKIDPIEKDPDFPVFRLTTFLSKKVPSGAGYVMITLGGKKYRFVVRRYEGTVDAPIRAGTPTDRIVVVFRPDVYKELRRLTPEQFADQLSGQQIQIYLNDYRPQIRTTEDLLKGIQNRLEDIQLNQLRQTP